MAFISKDEVNAKALKLKALNKAFKDQGIIVKSSFSGSNSPSLTLTIQSSSIDFIENHLAVRMADSWEYNNAENIQWLKDNRYIQVNHYYLKSWFNGTALDYLQKVYSIMLEGHFDKSDSQTDYFHCAWYNHIQIGKWDKPFVLIEG